MNGKRKRGRKRDEVERKRKGKEGRTNNFLTKETVKSDRVNKITIEVTLNNLIRKLTVASLLLHIVFQNKKVSYQSI